MGRTKQNLVGERVKKARIAAQLTQLQLSERLSKSGVQIDRAGVAKIECGIRGVLDFELVALAKELKVKINWLLGVAED